MQKLWSGNFKKPSQNSRYGVTPAHQWTAIVQIRTIYKLGVAKLIGAIGHAPTSCLETLRVDLYA